MTSLIRNSTGIDHGALHDSTLQTLYGINLKLEDVLQLLRKGDPAAEPELESAIRLVSRLMREVRKGILELPSPDPDDPAALEALLEEITINTLASVEVRRSGEDFWAAMQPQQRRCLLTVVRESMLNISEHARAQHVTVDLRLEDEAAVIVIADDGIGFDPEAVKERRRGLLTMEKEAAATGVDLAVESSPGAGTKVRLTVPLEREKMADPIRVMLVDDHEVVREGLRALLNRRPGMTVVAEAGTVAQAIDVALKEKPDVIVLDVRLPDGSGVEACREIREQLPDTRTIMLTSYADDEAVLASILAGASAYFLKQTRGQQLAEAVEAVARGESLLDPQVTQRVMEQMRGFASGKNESNQLNENENKILRLIAEGKTNREIAAEVFLSDKTVKNYVSSILSKLNLRRRSEAAAYIARRTNN